LATSPPEVLTVASPRDNTYAVSLPVGAGDVIGLDNSDGALMFDRSSSGSITDYFQPALASNSVPDRLGVATNGYRLLLSATITASPPSLKKVSQSRRRWRAGNKLPVLDPAVFAKQPVGTVIRFTLGEPATVRFSFAQLLSGRRVNGKCVAPTAANRRRRSCTRSVPRGSLAYDKTSVRGYGPTRFCNCGEMLVFQGRLTPTRNLRPGTYTVTITATNIAGQRASKALRPFTIIGG
jgi:hypothetical protein